MSTYQISSWSDLISNTYSSGDILNFTQNITTDDTISVINLTSATLNGNGYKITFSGGRTKGLFQVSGATIKDLTIDGNSTTIGANESFFLAYNTGVRDQYATFTNCVVQNGQMNNYCGGYLARFSTQNSTNTTTFTNCQANNLTLGSRFCGGFCAEYSSNITLTSCSANITMGSATEAGGFIAHNLNGTNLITDCNATIDQINGGACGGLISRIGGGTTTINRSYCNVTSGVNTAYSAILAGGMTTSVDNGTTLNITDSYAIGDLTNYSGALVGYHTYNGTVGEPNTVNVTRCYHVGNYGANTRSICGWYTDTNRPFNVTDCVVGSTDFNRGGGAINLVRVDTSLESINAQNLPNGTDLGQSNVNGFADNWSNLIWTEGTNPGDFPTLKALNEGEGEGEEDNCCCLFPGTIIFTNEGPQPIEKVSEGSFVLRENGEMCKVVQNISIIRKIADRVTSLKNLPIRIGKGAFGKIPLYDTYISRYHRFLYKGELKSYHEHMIDLNNTITLPKGVIDLNKTPYNRQFIGKTLIYHHLILESDQYMYFANGLMVESLPENNILVEI